MLHYERSSVTFSAHMTSTEYARPRFHRDSVGNEEHCAGADCDCTLADPIEYSKHVKDETFLVLQI